MSAEASQPERGGVVEGEGYAVAHIDDLGDKYGFRRIRRRLGVTAFGVNAVALPPGYTTPRHSHEHQEELYFVYQGTLEIEFGDGTRHRLVPGSVARVDAATVRCLHNTGDGDAIFFCAGGKDGYVGRDGCVPEGETRGPVARDSGDADDDAGGSGSTPAAS